jgi:hypothetical protein
LRHYATSQKVVGSIPIEIIRIFCLPKPLSYNLALGLTRPLTEMSNSNLPHGGVKCNWRVRLTALPPSLSQLSIKCWILDISQTYGSPWPATGITIFLYPTQVSAMLNTWLYMIHHLLCYYVWCVIIMARKLCDNMWSVYIQDKLRVLSLKTVWVAHSYFLTEQSLRRWLKY